MTFFRPWRISLLAAIACFVLTLVTCERREPPKAESAKRFTLTHVQNLETGDAVHVLLDGSTGERYLLVRSYTGSVCVLPLRSGAEGGPR